ncbi:amino acid permease-domain-containing protein [Aspergillus pseudotamarii]|uniref:Amino acid permease-domain-containing protein n=1 Tax=Aspergillus pseudotamarii TaxID=132259 RepID=A0A5N6STV9_ASPPS|nr:amino acid permease-domain-containing protein [Aspergillus pseudotamarii]KAE8137211.1 amino acid permease-domain-containing protein [Aspergillus pseudotamarii]
MAIKAKVASAAEKDDIPVESRDMQLLATLGFKQELRRHYSTTRVFAVAFSIMGLLPSISSTLFFSIPAGPVGMVWGWLAASIFIFIVGLAMADLASAMPTAGGPYFWTQYFSGDRWKNPLSFIVGYSNTIGLLGGVCSVDYGFATMLLSVDSLTHDGNWTASRAVVYGTYVVCGVVHGLIATFFGRNMPKIQSTCIVSNGGLVLATILALPIGKAIRGGHINAGAYVFGHLRNLTTWPQGWAFMLAWLSPIWTIGVFNSCVHMSEEATHAARAIPLVIVAVIDVNLDGVLSTNLGQPMAQIYYDCLGKSGALGFMIVVAIVQFFMGLSLVIAASRQSWAFSRDGALPFFFRNVSKKIRYQPVRMIWGVVVSAVIVGLLCIISSTASNAISSLAVAGNDLAWMMPILCRLVWGQDYKPIAVTTIDMNHTVVINGALRGGALLYYGLYARKVYKGPQTTVGSSSSVSEANLGGL